MLKRDEIKEAVKNNFKKCKGHYGSPRLTIELQQLGHDISRATVARVMKSEGLIARPRAKYIHTTDSNHDYQVAENILNRNFETTRLNEKWVSDITYIPTFEGWTYLTIILDLADRMIVAWNLSSDMTTDNTTIKTMKLAMERRKVIEPLILHSDRGVQYCSNDFTNLLSQNKHIKQSMSRKGNCWDNAVAESFFKSLKTEWVRKLKYRNIEDAQRSIFDYIESVGRQTKVDISGKKLRNTL